MGNMIRTLTHRIRERGAAAVESLIALPIVIILMMGAAEWARVYEAKTTLDHAAVQGARAGAVDHAQPSAIQQGIARGMLPFYAPRSGNLIQTQAELVATLGTQSRLRILNPTPETFDDFGLTENGRRVLPNSDLKNRSTAIGASSGLNIQDANLLKVETTWGVELRMPFIRQVISFIGQGTTTPGSFEHQLYRNGMIPVSATTLVRMQSEAWENSLMVSIADQGTERTQGGPQEQLATGGTSTPWGGQTGYDGNLASSYVPDHLGNGSDFAHPDWADGHGQGGTGSDLDTGDTGGNSEGDNSSDPLPDESDSSDTEEEPLCEVPPEEEVEEEEDSSFFGDLWDDLIDLGKSAYDFVRGFWEGIKSQLSDIASIITDPVETAKGLYELGKAFIEDPEGVARMIFGDLYQDFETVLECGAYDRGRIVGEYINPVFMLKIATKLAKFDDVAEAIARAADDLGCPIGGSSNSFAAGTQVWTPDGFSPIESIQVGDLVQSRSEQGFTDAVQQVTALSRRVSSDYYQLVTETDSLKVTGGHPVWVQAKGWVPAASVKPQDVIATVDGDASVYFISHIEEPLEVFNFSVANTPSYFVGNGGLWVHNTTTCTLPERIDDLENRRLDDISVKTGVGAVGEAKVNRILEEDLDMEPLGNQNLDWRKVDDPQGWKDEYAKYVGSTGIDSIFRGKDGKIYIVESKSSGSKDYESCKAGSLCTTKGSGQQMSQDWINRERLEASGLKPHEVDQVLEGLDENDGSVVRLYAGTSASGQTKFYEIHDRPGSTSKVTVDRAGDEYEFYQ